MKRLAGAPLIAFLLVALLPGTAAALMPTPPGDLDKSSEGIMDPPMASQIRPADSRLLAVTFTAGKTGLLTYVQLNVEPLDDGTITVDVLATDGSGLPTGSSIATATTPVLMTDAPAWRNFVFPMPLQITAGTQYALVVTGSVAAVGYWRHTSPPAGANREMWRNMPGGSWFADSTYGYAFRTYVFQGPALHWSATSMVAGTTATLTLTETFTFSGVGFNVTAGAQPNAVGPYYIEQVALPGWFTVTGASCSSQVNVTCDATNFLAGATLAVTPDGNPIVVTLTGTASPPAGAAGTKGTVTGQTCFSPSGDPICAPGSADILILAPGATPPPSTTGSGDKDASDTTAWLLPAALLALFGATFVSMRRGQPVR